MSVYRSLSRVAYGGPMTRRCILQIGTEKTGTTSLQTFLARNRDRLEARGVRYPRFPGAVNHTGLAAYAMDDARRDPLRAALGVDTDAAVSQFRSRLERHADVELSGPGLTVLCNEHCHSRLTTAAEVRRLSTLLAPHFDRIDISIYLRRQDRVAISLYSTRLKSGAIDRDVLPATDADDPYFNYDRSLSVWEAVFGRAHVHVRLFDRRELVAGNVIDDFLAAWGLGGTSEYRPVEKFNESISAPAQDFLRRVNATFEPLPGLPEDFARGPLADLLARHFPGRGHRPARAAAEAFYALYRDSNEAVRRRYFPERPALFDDTFDAYPPTPDQSAFGADEMALIASRLQSVQTREIRRLEAEIRIRDGRLAWQDGEREIALGFFRQAVDHLPHYAEAARTLAEFLYRAGRYDEAAAQARTAATLKPDTQDYWHFLGVALEAAGDVAGAVAAQERALEIEPSHEPSRRTLAALRKTLPETHPVS